MTNNQYIRLFIILLLLSGIMSCRSGNGPDESTASHLSDSIQADEYRRMGTSLAMKDQLELARAYFDTSIKFMPDYASAYAGRGLVRFGLKDFQGAVKDATKAIFLEPNEEDWWGNRAYAKMTMQNDTGAMNDYNHALELNEDFAWAYFNRGCLKFKLGDRAGACDDWGKAFSRDFYQAADSIFKYCR